MATIFGTNGADALRGTAAADEIYGLAGDDSISGLGGPDSLLGSLGNDTLIGGMGADHLIGGSGNDLLVGGFGNDILRGGSGNDVFTLGPSVRVESDYSATFLDFGRDSFGGGAGTDTIQIIDPGYSVPDDLMSPDYPYTRQYGAPDARINLSLGTLRIGDSPNRSSLLSIENVETGSGDDSVNGNSGANLISVGHGGNVVYAGNGDDTVIGGNRYLYDGRAGELLNGGGGNDAIYGNGARDFGDPLGIAPGSDTLAGGGGDDTLYGGAAFQTMSGGEGDDVFVLTDALSTDAYHGDSRDFYATTTIVDFDAGDTIRFSFEVSVSFAGATAADDLDLGEFGYHREGSDTIIQVRFSEDGEHDQNFLEITLANHTGGLTAADFDFV